MVHCETKQPQFGRDWGKQSHAFSYEHPLKEYTKMEDRANSSSSLSVKMALIIEILERNLEVESEIY